MPGCAGALKTWITVGLGLGALLLAAVSLTIGQAGFDLTDQTARFAILEIRLPRVLMALAVAISVSGSTALLQLALRNQIAEPALFGLTAFAGLGTLLGLSLGFGFGSLGVWPLAITATVLGLVPLGLIAKRAQATIDRDSARVRNNLPVIGVSMGAIAVAAVGLAAATSPDMRLRSVAIWAFGSLSLQTLRGAALSLGLALGFLLLTLVLSSSLQKLALGPSLLRGLGIGSNRVLLLAFGLTAVFAATSAFGTGSIAFVGLLAVTLGRLIYGSRLAPQLLGSSLIALAAILACDLLARSLAAPIELPIGLFTALVGAPILIWSLTRRTLA